MSNQSMDYHLSTKYFIAPYSLCLVAISSKSQIARCATMLALIICGAQINHEAECPPLKCWYFIFFKMLLVMSETAPHTHTHLYCGICVVFAIGEQSSTLSLFCAYCFLNVFPASSLLSFGTLLQRVVVLRWLFRWCCWFSFYHYKY